MMCVVWRSTDSRRLRAQQQQMVSPASSSQERVLTLSVPQGRERHLTGSDIKKLTWPEYIGLYEVRCSTCYCASFMELQQCWMLIMAVLRRQAAASSTGYFQLVSLLMCICFCLQSYLEEMAAMLLQAQGNGDSPAGLRLQRLCTELVSHVIPCAHSRNICTQAKSVVPA